MLSFQDFLRLMRVKVSGRKVKVYRFANQRSDLTSRLSKAGRVRKWVSRLLLRSRRYRMWRAKRHARGDVAYSPFISVVLDPAVAAVTIDPWLIDITRNTTYLYELDVPAHLLVDPDTPLSAVETERLVLAEDLALYVTNVHPNPYL